jgi:hypothetical protein
MSTLSSIVLIFELSALCSSQSVPGVDHGVLNYRESMDGNAGRP